MGAPLYRSAQLREIERTAQGGEPLMARAGLALALHAKVMASSMASGPGAIRILAGPGNNGGDGLVAARHLKAWGFVVEVLLAGNADALPGDARAAMRDWLAMGGCCVADWPAGPTPALIVDALFGIGLTRPPAPPFDRWIELANASGSPILAVDVPTGLDADTGHAFAPAIRAHETLTFIAMKPGLFTLDGPDHAGRVALSGLGLHVPRRDGALLVADDLRGLLPARPRNSHKGRFGALGVLGGAPGMAGAALLAARAALHAGAGRVHCALLDERRPAYDPMQPELMLDTPEQLATRRLDVLVAGPGMGASGAALELLAHWLAQPVALVLDADALNLVAAHAELREQVARRERPVLLTPHPAEAGRLLDTETQAVQADRVAAALELSRRYRADTVLKGVGSVVAGPDGRYRIDTGGNPGMAGPGQGDLLAGIAGALLAQGLKPADALCLAVFVHGQAADRAVAAGIGPVGLCASECLADMRRALNACVGRASPEHVSVA
jgi:hydroxyethylthiazole kinase-like uncharacterized protein yjeF